MDSLGAPAGDMEAQLRSLYEDREILERELSVSDPHVIIAMIRSMEAQLIELYAEKESRWSSGSSLDASSMEIG